MLINENRKLTRGIKYDKDVKIPKMLNNFKGNGNQFKQR